MDQDRPHILASQLATLPAQWIAGFPLSCEEEGVVGHFFKCELHSQYETLTLDDIAITKATLAVTGPDGSPFPADKLFSLAAGADGLLKLDRLCRLVHALNHFIVAGRADRLLVAIHPRLFKYVKSAHGQTFARMLRHFELAPEQLVLELPAGLPVSIIESYQAEGFGVHLNSE